MNEKLEKLYKIAKDNIQLRKKVTSMTNEEKKKYLMKLKDKNAK